MEKIIWTAGLKNEKELQVVMEEKKFLHTKKRREGNWIGDVRISFKTMIWKER